MFSFTNIDRYIPERFERMGMLKGKRWYHDLSKNKRGLFKPKRFEHGNRKVFCANHYGEFLGYVLALESDVPACEVNLAHLSKYYPNIHKERNGGTPIEKDGCITYKTLEDSENLDHGKSVIESFIMENPDLYHKLTENESRRVYESDNIEIVLAAIEARIRKFYKLNSDTIDCSQEHIEEKIKSSKFDAIRMMVYDCLYGNNDRHDENWAMKVGDDIGMYPLYDNERVLGLYENQNFIENAVKSADIEEISEKQLFSRMRVPGEKKEYSSYKDVLQYLIEKYPKETILALQKPLAINTPKRINSYLKNCERLPQCYVDFGTTMYKLRYNFAKELYMNKNLEGIVHKNDSVFSEDGR